MSRGLGESSAFSEYHPIVNITFYGLTIGITMFTMSPLFLACTLILSWCYSILLSGRSAVKMNLILSFWTVLIMTLINVLFTHNGDTVLFYINGNRITLEALIYGVSAAVMLCSVIIWFSSFNVIITAEKLIYLFGKAAPVLGLTLSMIFRYIPLLKKRYDEISMGQKCMAINDSTRMGELRRGGKKISILISWSLESSIDSADSMEARGYGLKGRTGFHLYRFTGRDALMELWLCGMGAVCISGCVMDAANVSFYPLYKVHEFDGGVAVTLIAFALLMATPIVIDIIGEMKWKRSDLTI